MNKKEKSMKCTLSSWLGLLENLNMKKIRINKELDYQMHNFYSLTHEERASGCNSIDELNNISEFTNKVMSILRKNDAYKKIEMLFDEMSDKEIGKGYDINKCRSISEISEYIQVLYQETVEIKFDKSLSEYVGY